MLKKNDIVRVRITDFSENGEGIGKAEGFPLFVRHAVIGDEADVIVTSVKKSYGYGRIKELIHESENRRKPPCSAWKRCGGCQFQNVSYEAQLEYKTNKVKQAIERIGGISNIDVKPCIASPEEWYYRNKAQYPVGTGINGELCAGFYAGRTHEIIPCENCQLGPAEFNDVVKTVLLWMKEFAVTPYDEKTGKGIIRHIYLRKGFQSGEIALCLICNSKKLKRTEELIRMLKEYPEIKSISYSPNLKKTNVIMGDEVVPVYGELNIQDSIGEISYSINPLSFYQVNNAQTKQLYDCVKEFAHLTGKEHVWDLYCGIGSITLYLAKEARSVTGIEVVERAIEDAKENAKRNKITNARFYAGDVSKVFPLLCNDKAKGENIVVVDPPRKGCDRKTLDTILEVSPERIVYVSCNPSTLARDLRILTDGGYELKTVQPFDMFPNGVHVETVVLLCREAEEAD